jgi:hypothetical protein
LVRASVGRYLFVCEVILLKRLAATMTMREKDGKCFEKGRKILLLSTRGALDP